MIREARPDELAAVGDLRVAAYEAGGFLNPEYAPELRALGTQGDGTVLVAVPEDRPAAGPGDGSAAGPGDGPGRGLANGVGPIAGTIMLVTWPLAGELVVAQMTSVRGSSNEKARKELGWEPRYASWREGFRAWVR